MMIPLLVKVGHNVELKKFVIAQAKKAGYNTGFAEKHVLIATGFRFEEATSGYASGDCGCYANGEFEGRYFDVATEMVAMLEWLDEQKNMIMLEVDGIPRQVEFAKNGDVIVGCTRVSSELFNRIVARRAKILASKG